MKSQPSETVKAVFQSALERPTPADRLAFLDRACGAEEELRRRVAALLRAHDAPDPLLDHPAAELLEAGDAVDRPEDWLDFLDPPARPGSLGRLDHYEVLEVAGRGGMGIVFRAVDDKLRRTVAIKALAPGLASCDRARGQFVREARAAAAVAHDNVVTIHGVEDAGAVPYLVMQFVTGTSLQQRIGAAGPLPLEAVLRIGLQVADGLGAAHRQGLVHRDVKPANILLENGVERVKITDFGLARAGDDADPALAGPLAGTPAYMSPEQARGDVVDARSDLFSLGSVLYAMCTGRPPFGTAPADAVLGRVCEASPVPVREVSPGLPDWLDDLLSRLLAKAPGDRPSSAREVADLLSRRLAELRAAGVSAAPQLRSSPGPRSRWPLSRAGRWAAAAVGVSTVSLAVVGTCEIAGVTDLGGRAPRGVRASVGPLPSSGQPPAPASTSPAEDVAAWERAVATLPADDQAKAVAARLAKLNPGFDGTFTHTATPAGVMEFRFSSEHVSDITPVRALTSLQSLDCSGPTSGRSRLADLTPLRGLSLQVLECSDTVVCNLSPLAGMQLVHLVCTRTRVSDLSPLRGMPLQLLVAEELALSDVGPLRGMPLTWLGLYKTRVADLSPLAGLPLEYLNVTGTRVADLSALRNIASLRRLVLSDLPITDLSALRGLPLVSLQFHGTPVTDLSPLEGMPLQAIELDVQLPRDAPVLRALKQLRRINHKPAGAFWSDLAG